MLNAEPRCNSPYCSHPGDGPGADFVADALIGWHHAGCNPDPGYPCHHCGYRLSEHGRDGACLRVDRETGLAFHFEPNTNACCCPNVIAGRACNADLRTDGNLVVAWQSRYGEGKVRFCRLTLKCAAELEAKHAPLLAIVSGNVPESMCPDQTTVVTTETAKL